MNYENNQEQIFHQNEYNYYKLVYESIREYDQTIKIIRDAIDDKDNENLKIYTEIVIQCRKVRESIDKIIEEYNIFKQTKNITDYQINDMLDNSQRLLQMQSVFIDQFGNVLMKMFNENISLKKRYDTINISNRSNNQPYQSYLQIDQLQEKIHFYEDQINQFKIKINTLTTLNKEYLEINLRNIDNQVLVQKLFLEKSNEMAISHIQNKKAIMETYSKKIDENIQQFNEKINKINKDRDQIIKNMEDILKQSEEIQTRNKQQQNKDNQYFDENQYQNILNQIRTLIGIIDQMEKSLDTFLNELNSNKKNENNKIILDLIQKLNGNRECFNSVKKALTDVINMLVVILDIYAKQNQKNQEFQKQLEKYENENKEIKNKFESQLNQLKEQNKSEQQYNQKQDCNNILNKYVDLFNQLNQQILQKINDLSKIILILFPKENRTSQANSLLVKDIQNFIQNIENLKLNYDNDSLEQQWQTIIELFTKIYPKFTNNAYVSQYTNQTLQKILQIISIILQNKKNINRINQEFQSQVRSN